MAGRTVVSVAETARRHAQADALRKTVPAESTLERERVERARREHELRVNVQDGRRLLEQHDLERRLAPAEPDGNERYHVKLPGRRACRMFSEQSMATLLASPVGAHSLTS